MPEKPKDPILEWPFARDFVLETMDHDAIQRHGELILCRALDIEAYAEVMGMSRLEVETAFVDASFRRELGDLVMAMKRVTRSLAIANDCDLVLRKIGGMLLAAEISSDLGMCDGARTLAETARAAAVAAEYSIAQDKAQNLLASLSAARESARRRGTRGDPLERPKALPDRVEPGNAFACPPVAAACRRGYIPPMRWGVAKR